MLVLSPTLVPAMTGRKQQVFTTTYKAVGDCQVLVNALKIRSRVGIRVEESPLSPSRWVEILISWTRLSDDFPHEEEYLPREQVSLLRIVYRQDVVHGARAAWCVAPPASFAT